MSAAFGHPHKTELGLDELRRRTRGLSQRHRTMLLLVNGKRTRREVLTLAGQAGVGAEFFEELVAMGMVDAARELPREAGPASEPVLDDVTVVNAGMAPVSIEQPVSQPAEEGDRTARAEPDRKPPTAAATPKASAVVSAAAASGPPRPRRAAPPVLTMDDAVPMAATRASTPKGTTAAPAKSSAPNGRHLPENAPASAPMAVSVANGRSTPRQEASESTPARMRFGAAVHKPKTPIRRAPPVELRQEPHLTPVKQPGRSARIKMLAPVGPLDDEGEMNLLAEVRSLLIGTLLVDGPVTSSLTALRVRKARNRYDLTALVWEIERTLVRARRPREAQSRLAKARDLLGLGNTVTEEEASPGGATHH